MRKSKTIRGAFYTNTSITDDFLDGKLALYDLDNDWFIYYTDESDNSWKIAPSGTENATTSPVAVTTGTTETGVTSITVNPSAVTFTTSGETQQLTVYDQDSNDVTSECTFVSGDDQIATVNSSGLVTAVGTSDVVDITVTHSDGPIATVQVNIL